MVGSLRLRIFATLLLPVSLTGLLACVASYATLQASYRTLLGARLAIVAEDLASGAEDDERIGQPLATSPVMQRLLDQAKAQNADVADISAILEDGRIVFDTDLAAIGERVPAAWLPGGQLGGEVWSQPAGDGLLIGAPMVNSFQRPFGGVLVRVSGALIGFHKIAAFRAVALVALAFMGLATLACYAAAAQLARTMGAPLLRAVRDLDAAAALLRAGADPAAAPGEEAAIVASVRAVAMPLIEAERHLRRADEAA